MAMDIEFDFADIVNALDPNDPINNQPLSVDIGVDVDPSKSHQNISPTNTINHQTMPQNSNINNINNKLSSNNRNVNNKSKLKTINNSNHNNTNHSLKLNKKPRERDLNATNKLLNRLKDRKQDKLFRIAQHLHRKNGGDIFGSHLTEEVTLKCPWCGDNKGYRYFTKHLSLKCNYNINNGFISTRSTRKRSTRNNNINYTQYMNDNDDDETDDDDVYQTNTNQRNHKNVRTRRNHRQQSDDDYVAPQTRSKRKR
eukprot:331083_1